MPRGEVVLVAEHEERRVLLCARGGLRHPDRGTEVRLGLAVAAHLGGGTAESEVRFLKFILLISPQMRRRN